MANNLSGYELSRQWFDFCFDNPEKISTNHHAIFFFAIEHCNRLGWKEKFGFPTQMAMDAIGIKKHQTYIKYFLEICDWGFFVLIQRSVNQYSANIISLNLPTPKNGKSLGKAIITHAAKQINPMGQSNSSIDKPYNHITINHQPTTISKQQVIEFLRSAGLPSDRVEYEANELMKVYNGKGIKNLKALCNTWAENVRTQQVMPSPEKNMNHFI